MYILDRYLMKQIAGGILISTLVLIPLFSFLDLVDQLDDVGTGFYKTSDAFLYVLMTTPRRFIQISPFIALLGNVTALGRLAMNHELISLRSAGYSPVQISAASMKIGLILILVIGMLEVFVAPSLQQDAISHRSAAMEQSAELGNNLGVWTRDDNQILRIGNLAHETSQANVEILGLDNKGNLSEYIHAEGFEIVSYNEWILHNVVHKTFSDETITSSTLETMPWNSFLNDAQISTLTKPQESLSPMELFHYVQHLKATGQESDIYSLSLWKKLGGPIMMLGMLLISVPFVFGSVRTGFSTRLVMAGVTGIMVYILDQIFSNAGLILKLDPSFIALVPGILLIWFARVWLHRVP